VGAFRSSCAGGWLQWRLAGSLASRAVRRTVNCRVITALPGCRVAHRGPRAHPHSRMDASARLTKALDRAPLTSRAYAPRLSSCTHARGSRGPVTSSRLVFSEAGPAVSEATTAFSRTYPACSPSRPYKRFGAQSRHQTRPIRDRFCPWLWGDGRGVSGDRHEAEASGRHQDPADVARG
jgi:hypothetical protein